MAIALRTITPALDCRAFDGAWEWLQECRIETRGALLCSEARSPARSRSTRASRTSLGRPDACSSYP